MDGSKQIAVVLAILAAGSILFVGNRDISSYFPSFSFSLPSLEISRNSTDATLSVEAWNIFQNYLKFAKNHDLIGIRSLSHQISATCNDPAKENDCFALMDSVYSFASPLKLSDFNHIQSDERQIVMYTDGPTVATLYFTRNADDTKVLGMRFCFEDETTIGTCVMIDSLKQDSNNNGWWDSVESLFY
ncbi:MAG: hypothetical protein HYX23_00900 [Candidatus Zambryskibacteria bacterium]|nr:hypothetical protein [Candidatus Zambryskibacteria bacterium]